MKMWEQPAPVARTTPPPAAEVEAVLAASAAALPPGLDHSDRLGRLVNALVERWPLQLTRSDALAHVRDFLSRR
jgi:hypothetical protein